MRIALDARECLDPATGMGRMALEVIPHLAARARHEWVVLVPRGAALPPALVATGLELLPVEAAAYHPREHVELPRTLARAGIEALHALTYALPLWPGRPTGITLYDPVPRLYPSGYRLRAQLYWCLVLPHTARRARVVVTLSQRAASDVARLLDLDPARLAVISSGVGAPFGPVPEDTIEATLERLEIERPYIFAHGNARPHKNLTTLIHAHTLLSTSRPRLSLVISGGPGQGAPGRQRTPTSLPALLRPGVMALGRVDDATLAALYAGAAAYALPSLYEGGGLTPLEAMACGAPCVLSDRGALPELYRECARFAQPEAQALADALAPVLDDVDTAKALRARGLERVREATWERTAQALEEALARLAAA